MYRRIGQIRALPSSTVPCRCGQLGRLEALSGAAAIIDQAQQAGDDGRSSFMSAIVSSRSPVTLSDIGDALGARGHDAPMLVEWVLEYGAVAAAVDYRLASEFPDPVPLEDCYAGLGWFAGRAEVFGFDPRRVLIGGPSAGGGLSIGTSLLARDRGGPMPAAMLLMWPMLDDRNETVSALQIDGVGIWDRTSNETGWTALLGDRRGTADVSIYAAPARATDLAGLPPAYIEAGSAEVFRDEAVALASRIWEVGGSAELHIWAGGFHGFQTIVPTAAVSQRAVQARESWVRRVLAP
jgi:acetyl esterase/lipase